MSTPSRHGTRAKACADKKAFDDEEYAWKAARDMDARYARPSGWFEAYLCPFCRKTHVGHETKARQRSAVKSRKSYRRP